MKHLLLSFTFVSGICCGGWTLYICLNNKFCGIYQRTGILSGLALTFGGLEALLFLVLSKASAPLEQ
jgi:hypothetical protein